MNGGKSYLIYVGGKNLDAENLKIDFSSPFFAVTPKSITLLDYGSEISVVSFEVKINAETPAGDYSFRVRDKSGSADFIIGGLTVENFVNPWNSRLLF